MAANGRIIRSGAFLNSGLSVASQLDYYPTFFDKSSDPEKVITLSWMMSETLALGSVDSDDSIFDGQTGIVILPAAGSSFKASGNRVTIDQGGVRRNQIVTAESTSSITITANLTGFTLPGSATLMVHVPR